MDDRKATILSWSAERLSSYPAPPHHYGQLDFEGGGRILMEFTDVAPGDIETGMEMDLVFRVKERDPVRGFTRYFWKAVPATTSGATCSRTDSKSGTRSWARGEARSVSSGPRARQTG